MRDSGLLQQLALLWALLRASLRASLRTAFRTRLRAPVGTGVLAAGLALGLATAGPLRAQEFRFEDLGTVRAAGKIAPEAFLSQFILLDVAESGHYRLSMASPGALLLHAFETE
ncbi:MAG: hypothetical protein AAGC86_16165, partial [Pseudomonadota bacterium]